jgi:hypothetical protein
VVLVPTSGPSGVEYAIIHAFSLWVATVLFVFSMAFWASSTKLSKLGLSLEILDLELEIKVHCIPRSNK